MSKIIGDIVYCKTCGKELGKVSFDKMYICSKCEFLFYLKKKPLTLLDFIED